MLRVQEAVKQARAYLPELFFESDGRIDDVRLEEVELSDDEKFWGVTFSFFFTPVNPSGSIALRQYKTIRIRSLNGDFVGVRNGMLATV